GIDDPPGPIGLPPLLRAVADTRLGLSVHAEDPKMFGRQPAVDPAGWNAARPPSAELLSVRSLIDAAPDDLRLHVAHVTTVNAAQLLREKGFSFESTPHHLLLSEKTGRGTWGKVNPPLRSAKDRAALFDEFVSGRVPCLASDHAPHSVQEKEKSFPLAPSGVPGVETMLPLFLSHVREGRVPLPTLLQAACDRPARWLGMPHGRIAIGHRAHLIAVDFRQRSRIAAERLASPCGWTPFEGKPAIFPTHHFRHGRLIVEDGQFVGLQDGRVVRPEYAP
ncbi:MAG: dihydroorotase, partial [Thermoplasmata archaeon]|nr:dihydroorotase [Thermoplasmata archaeon]